MPGTHPATLLCQLCGATNPEDQEYCQRCQHKLLVLSGQEDADFEQPVMEESFSFDEHLLERISVLEEVVKRTGETVRQLLGMLRKQEHNLLVNQTGLMSLLELLEHKGLVSQSSWSELWESRMEHQLLTLEKRDRFLAVREHALALYHGPRRQELQQLLTEAELAFHGMDADGALRALEAAYALDPRNYELAHLLGESAFNDGQPERAAAYFHRLLEVKPDHFEALVYCGVLEYEQGEGRRAEELLKRAVSLYPDAFLPLFSLGAVYAGRGQLSRAVIFLERAVAIEAVPQALYLLGNCCYEMGQLSAAIRHLEEAIRLDPAFEQAYSVLGLAYLDRHWHRKALDALRQAQRLSPKSMGVRYLSDHAGLALPPKDGPVAELSARAEQLMQHDNLRQASLCYREALRLEPRNPTVLLAYAQVCLDLNRGREIEAVARRVLDLNPDDELKATASATLIEALRSQGRYRESNRFVRRLLDEESSDFTKTIAYSEMAYNLAEMEEDLDEALACARRSVELSPEGLRQMPLAALGWVHYKRREFDQAIDCLARSTDLVPSAMALTHLGMALLAAGRRDQARAVLTRVRTLERPGELESRMVECMKDTRTLRPSPRRDEKE